MHEDLQKHFHAQHFPNGYDLVNGVEMHAENADNFKIPQQAAEHNRQL